MRAACRRTLTAAALVTELAGCTRQDDVIATYTPGNAGQGTVDPLAPCSPTRETPGALARYDFEDPAGVAALTDSMGTVDAEVRGGTFEPDPGPLNCGQALAFGTAGLFAVVPDSAAWDLSEGSVELWLRTPEVMEGSYGVLGRDRVGTDLPGHFSLWLSVDRTITARLQGAVAQATHCSLEPLSTGQWLRVGFNFGSQGSELWVDGKRADGTGDPGVETIVPACGGSTADGIAGNQQPWVLGFDSSRSGDSVDGLLQHFDGGAIDGFTISSVRRDFAAP